jgi:futalosine hydrolase
VILPLGGRVLLVAVASVPEARALFPGPPPAFWEPRPVAPGVDAVLTGLGKANAAGAVARALDTTRHGGVLSIGVGGSLPGSGLAVGTVVAGSAAVFSDEGVATPAGLVPASALGFPAGIESETVRPDPTWLAALAALGLPAVPIATVSACCGTDALAAQTAARTGAAVEAMEGAAVGLVAARLGLAFAEVRAVSNTTGDRAGQVWDLPAALAALAEVFTRIVGPTG